MTKTKLPVSLILAIANKDKLQKIKDIISCLENTQYISGVRYGIQLEGRDIIMGPTFKTISEVIEKPRKKGNSKP